MAYFKCKGRLHRWQKWDSVMQYSQATRYIVATNIIWEGLPSRSLSMYRYGNGASLDRSTGLFTLSGGSVQTVSATTTGNAVANYRNRIVGYPNGSNIVSQYAQQTSSSMGSILFKYYNTNNFIAPDSATDAHKVYSVGTYIKGTTQYNNVASADINAYPTNGRASDGYWYILIQ